MRALSSGCDGFVTVAATVDSTDESRGLRAGFGHVVVCVRSYLNHGARLSQLIGVYWCAH